MSLIVVNFWVAKAALKLGEDGSEAWKVSAIYNTDRRTGSRFDPTVDAFQALLGSEILDILAGQCTGTMPDQACTFQTEKGEVPSVKAKITPDKQTLAWSTKSDSISDRIGTQGLIPRFCRFTWMTPSFQSIASHSSGRASLTRKPLKARNRIASATTSSPRRRNVRAMFSSCCGSGAVSRQ